MIPVGILAAATPRGGGGGGSGDPHWGNVVSLMSFDSGFVDHVTGVSWERLGGPSISTESPRFGKGCGNFGATAYVRRLNLYLQQAPFTIEFQLLRTGASDRTFLNIGGTIFYLTSTGSIIGALGILTDERSLGGNLPVGEWVHFALVRDGPSLSVFVGGVKTGTTDIGAGTFGAADMIYGYAGAIASGVRMDEARITRGVARYSENFIPPAEPFPRRGA